LTVQEFFHKTFVLVKRSPSIPDLNATRQLQIQLEVTSLSDPSVQWFSDVGNSTAKLLDIAQAAVSETFQSAENFWRLRFVDDYVVPAIWRRDGLVPSILALSCLGALMYIVIIS